MQAQGDESVLCGPRAGALADKLMYEQLPEGFLLRAFTLRLAAYVYWPQLGLYGAFANFRVTAGPIINEKEPYRVITYINDCPPLGS